MAKISGWAGGKRFEVDDISPGAQQGSDSVGRAEVQRQGHNRIGGLVRRTATGLRPRALPWPGHRTMALLALGGVVLGSALLIGGRSGVATNASLNTEDHASSAPVGQSDTAAAPVERGETLATEERSPGLAEPTVSENSDTAASQPRQTQASASGEQVPTLPESSIAGAAIVLGGASVGVGETTEIALTLSGVSDGLSGFDVVVTVEDGALAEILEADFPSFGLSETRRLASNQLRLRAVDLANIAGAETDPVKLVTLDILGKEPGSSQVTVTVNSIDDDGGAAIRPAIYSGRIVVR